MKDDEDKGAYDTTAEQLPPWCASLPYHRRIPTNKAQAYLDSRVQIVVADVVPQVHLGVRFRHPHHRLDVPHRNWDTPRSGGFATQVRVKLRQLALVDAFGSEW